MEKIVEFIGKAQQLVLHATTMVSTLAIAVIGLASSIYGFMTAVVKFMPTLGESHWFLPILKFFGRMTQTMVDHGAARTTASMEKVAENVGCAMKDITPEVKKTDDSVPKQG